MNKKILIIIGVIILILIVMLTYFIMTYSNSIKFGTPEGEEKLDFSYVQGTRPEYSPEGDTEGFAYPGTYKIKSQSWEGDKLKVVATTQSNLCAKKTGSYAIKEDTLTLTVKEELKTACNGIGFFDYTFIIGPIAQKDYKIIFQTENKNKFTIAFGQTKSIQGYTIYFKDVMSDIRCPPDVNCFWAGQAVIEVVVGDKTYELAEPPVLEGQTDMISGTSIKFINLDPYPTSATEETDKKDYVAEFEILTQ